MPLPIKDIRDRLRACQDKEWQPKLFSTMDRVPAHLRLNACALLGVDATGREIPTEQLKPDFEQAQALASLPVADRTALFEGLFPSKGAVVEAGWQLMRQLPYRAGFAWRSPNHEAPGLGLRQEWLTRTTALLAVFGNRPLPWFAAWHGHALGLDTDCLGVLLAAAMDLGGPESDELVVTVQRIAEGQDEIGRMTHDLIHACLCSRRPELKKLLTKLLLEAGREEGLRQKVLNRLEFSLPESFSHFGQLILEHRLARFSSTVQAFNGWFGFPFDAASGGKVEHLLRKVLEFLDDPPALAAGLRSNDAETVYLGLWAQAFQDVGRIQLEDLDYLLAHPHASHRRVVAFFTGTLNRAVTHKRLVPLLADKDWRVVAEVAGVFRGKATESVRAAGLFEALDALLERLPKTLPAFQPLVWPWEQYALTPDTVLEGLLANRGDRSPTLALRHLPKLSPDGRHLLATKLAKTAAQDAPGRVALAHMLGDASPDVRAVAAHELRQLELLEASLVPLLESLLDRKTGDLREHVLALLLKQSDTDTLASADRLLAAKSAPVRSAGLELLRQLSAANRAQGEASQRAERFGDSGGKLTAADMKHLEAILSVAPPKLTMADALGLAPASALTLPLEPQARPGPFASDTNERLARSLEAVFQPRNTKTFRLRSWVDDTEFDADLEVAFNYAAVPDDPAKVEAADAAIPLRPVWLEWLKSRGTELRDPDGFELLRLLARKFARWEGTLVESAMPEPERKRLDPIFGPDWAKSDPQKRWGEVCFQWLLRLDPPGGDWPSFVIDGFESTLALARETPFVKCASCADGWLHMARLGRTLLPQAWRGEHHTRLWRLLRWRYETAKARAASAGERTKTSEPMGRGGFDACIASLNEKSVAKSQRPRLDDIVGALELGTVTPADVCEHLLVGHRARYGIFPAGWYEDLNDLTQRHPTSHGRHFLLVQHPQLRPIVDRCRARLLEVELARGDTPTVATEACLSLDAVEGAETFLKLLQALAGRSFDRHFDYEKRDRDTVFGYLLRRCFPLAEDPPERFAALVKGRDFTAERLVEAAVYAPQWSRHAEAATGWAGLAEGIAWVHAHTKVAEWDANDAVKQTWRAEMALHSPLTGDELMDGAVDVAWFRRIHEQLGPKRWAVLSEAAKYASAGTGHTRARLFADALCGEASEKDLVHRIDRQRQQDAVRALGLLPLPAKGRDAAVLRRYEVLQEFVRGSRAFGAQRRASEKRAFEIGLANLARTAGYADPIRLQWAMEARAVADLADGPIAATVKDVTMSLGVDAWGEVETTVTQAGKPLKDLPAALRKRPEFVELRERKAELKRQAARIRASLETLMVRGDAIRGRELPELLRHPLLAPVLRGLVLCGDGIAGYPVKEGRVLERHDGSLEAVKAEEVLRIAHPLDLLPPQEWSAWQRECFARERVQPFKQVFRELYPLTATERDESTQTRRYAGHQVWPRQALALLGGRGWVSHPEEGVRKVIHEAGLVAWIEFQESWWTPADVEGLTLEAVYFTKRSSEDRLRLTEVPPRLFSETMRDLDLVVSVAHRGGVDPEASASSIEARAALVRETAAVLKLTNLRVEERVAVIKGKFGHYSVHLGSAVTHKLPGGMVFIVPVHSQHRGRLFLPFADDDPKSAEILSKVLLLARDEEIKDPAILAQIRR
ncbi:MAG: DUF4132 domain-containing protein [Verrucomicrobia subdivision 3 bacterium]|nr:DUF4132 domain-containing protein [Limisphaerales bacterium]